MPQSFPRRFQPNNRLLPAATQRFQLDESAPILIEFGDAGLSDAEQIERSAQGLNSALNSMRNMAKLVSESMSTLDDPSQAEVEFGIKLHANGSATIVQALQDASISVKLTWKPKTLMAEVYQSRGWDTDEDEIWSDEEDDEDEEDVIWEPRAYDEEDWDDDEELGEDGVYWEDVQGEGDRDWNPRDERRNGGSGNGGFGNGGLRNGGFNDRRRRR